MQIHSLSQIHFCKGLHGSFLDNTTLLFANKLYINVPKSSKFGMVDWLVIVEMVISRDEANQNTDNQA